MNALNTQLLGDGKAPLPLEPPRQRGSQFKGAGPQAALSNTFLRQVIGGKGAGREIEMAVHELHKSVSVSPSLSPSINFCSIRELRVGLSTSTLSSIPAVREMFSSWSVSLLDWDFLDLSTVSYKANPGLAHIENLKMQ